MVMNCQAEGSLRVPDRIRTRLCHSDERLVESDITFVDNEWTIIHSLQRNHCSHEVILIENSTKKYCVVQMDQGAWGNEMF